MPLLLFLHFISYIIIYFAVWKGINVSVKAAYLTVPMPYLLLTCLLIKGLTLEGSMDGLIYFLKPDFSKLKNLKLWQDAVGQIIMSS